MKKLPKMLVTTLALAALGVTGCTTTDMRDAALAGLLDYITGTTTDIITVISPLDNIGDL